MKRFIEIKGVYNVRDIGGYITSSGRKIKWNKIFRAGKISKVLESEIEKMKALQLTSICDFRTTEEQAKSPDQWPDLEQINRHSFPVGEGRHDKFNWKEKTDFGTGKESHLYKANQSYVLENAATYKDFFELLLNDQNYPLLYHCTAGKDRTGFATILLLSALGVDQKTIIADYLLTNEFLEKYFWKEMEAASIKHGFDLEAIKPILIASEDYIQGAFDAIEKHYGTMDRFLLEEIKIGKPEIEQLHHILVE